MNYIQTIYVFQFFFLFSDLAFPRFAEPIPNITVTIGRDALLGCVVDNLKNYKVSVWFFYRLMFNFQSF